MNNKNETKEGGTLSIKKIAFEKNPVFCKFANTCGPQNKHYASKVLELRNLLERYVFL